MLKSTTITCLAHLIWIRAVSDALTQGSIAYIYDVLISRLIYDSSNKQGKKDEKKIVIWNWNCFIMYIGECIANRIGMNIWKFTEKHINSKSTNTATHALQMQYYDDRPRLTANNALSFRFLLLLCNFFFHPFILLSFRFYASFFFTSIQRKRIGKFIQQ